MALTQKNRARISQSFVNIGLSPIVQISEKANGLAPEFTQRSGKPFAFFQRGEVDFLPAPRLRAALAEAVQSDDLARMTSCYPVSGGNPWCKQALIEHYRLRGVDGVTPDQVVLTYGGQEGLELVFNLFRGGRVLSFGPIWSCITENIAPYGDSEVQMVPFRSEGAALTVDFDLLERELAADTTLLYLNNPHNPTGKVFSREELSTINDLCLKHDVLIIADEAYKDIVFDGKKHVSMLEFEGDHIIVSSTGSKTYAATGYRFGWLICRDPELTQTFFKRGNYTQTAGVATVIQYAFSKALVDEGTEAWIKGVVERYQARREIIYAGLKPLFGENLYRPEGAFYFFVDLNPFLPKGTQNKEDLVLERCLAQGIALVPGSGFGGDRYQGFARLSYSTLGQEVLPSAVERFVAMVEGLRR